MGYSMILKVDFKQYFVKNIKHGASLVAQWLRMDIYTLPNVK